MMQIEIKNIFNNIFQVVIFWELPKVREPLVNIAPFTKLFYGAHSSFYY
jgi:hypothetical protein